MGSRREGDGQGRLTISDGLTRVETHPLLTDTRPTKFPDMNGLNKEIYCSLAQATGFTLRLHQAENVVLTDGTNDVANNAAIGITTLTNQLDTDLGDTTTGTGATEALDDASVFNFFLQKL